MEFASPGSSALLLGDNGDGKSTVLRCLAMGLCDESSAAGLFRELPGPFVRRQPDESPADVGQTGSITVELHEKGGCSYQIITKIETLTNFERVTQRVLKIQANQEGKSAEIDQREFPWQKIFVVGYGPGLRTGGTVAYEKYFAVDAVYPLFKYDVNLQSSELIIRRLIDTARDRVEDPYEKARAEQQIKDKIQRLMVQLLDLKSPDHFLITSTGVQVAGFWGTAGVSQLGDGYQATITWVLDFIQWWFHTQAVDSSFDWESIEGIVIIDEIEQHLHPRWQHRILPSLRRAFPNIQFVVATHSPLVASGCEDVEVHLFNKGKHSIIKPYGWLAENVYELMGLRESRATQFKKLLATYQKLDLKKIEKTATEKDMREWKRLNRILLSLPEDDPARISINMSNLARLLSEKK